MLFARAGEPGHVEARSPGRLLTRPANLRSQAADGPAGKLEAAGLTEAVAVTAAQPHWRNTPDGAPVRLRLLRAGLDALGIEPDNEEQQPTATLATVAQAAEPATQPDEAPRRTSKRAMIIALPGREGASVEAARA